MLRGGLIFLPKNGYDSVTEKWQDFLAICPCATIANLSNSERARPNTQPHRQTTAHIPATARPTKHTTNHPTTQTNTQQRANTQPRNQTTLRNECIPRFWVPKHVVKQRTTFDFFGRARVSGLTCFSYNVKKPVTAYIGGGSGLP